MSRQVQEKSDHSKLVRKRERKGRNKKKQYNTIMDDMREEQ